MCLLSLGYHSGSRSSSQTRTRYNESFAYRLEVRKVHERLRGYCQGQQQRHAMTPHDFRVRAWGLANGDGGHLGPDPCFFLSLSSSSSTISSSSWGAAATSQS